MSMLIPFWVWILLGFILGWKARGYFSRKLSFLDRIRRPFAPKRRKPPVRKKRPEIKRQEEEKPSEPEEDDSDDEMTGKERLKAAAKKGVKTLAKPWELILGDEEEEEDDE